MYHASIQESIHLKLFRSSIRWTDPHTGLFSFISLEVFRLSIAVCQLMTSFGMIHRHRRGGGGGGANSFICLDLAKQTWSDVLDDAQASSLWGS